MSWTMAKENQIMSWTVTKEKTTLWLRWLPRHLSALKMLKGQSINSPAAVLTPTPTRDKILGGRLEDVGVLQLELDRVAQAEEAKAKANKFFKTEKYPLVSYFNNFIELYSRRPAGHLWTTGCPVYSHVFPIFS